MAQRSWNEHSVVQHTDMTTRLWHEAVDLILFAQHKPLRLHEFMLTAPPVIAGSFAAADNVDLPQQPLAALKAGYRFLWRNEAVSTRCVPERQLARHRQTGTLWTTAEGSCSTPCQLADPRNAQSRNVVFTKQQSEFRCMLIAHALRCAARCPGLMGRPEKGSEVAGCPVATAARPAAVWVHPERCSTQSRRFGSGNAPIIPVQIRQLPQMPQVSCAEQRVEMIMDDGPAAAKPQRRSQTSRTDCTGAPRRRRRD